MRGANTIASRDRREPLDVGAEQPRKGVCLGFTKFREVSGHVRDRTVMLAHLHRASGLRDRRRIAVRGQGVR